MSEIRTIRAQVSGVRQIPGNFLRTGFDASQLNPAIRNRILNIVFLPQVDYDRTVTVYSSDGNIVTPEFLVNTTLQGQTGSFYVFPTNINVEEVSLVWVEERQFFFSNIPIADEPQYEARLSKIPSVNSRLDVNKARLSFTGKGNLEIINNDHEFDHLIHQWIFQNRRVSVTVNGESYFSGTIISRSFNSDKIMLACVDLEYNFDRQINHLSKSGNFIPKLIGYVEDVPGTTVSGIRGNAPDQISEEAENATLLSGVTMSVAAEFEDGDDARTSLVTLIGPSGFDIRDIAQSGDSIYVEGDEQSSRFDIDEIRSATTFITEGRESGPQQSPGDPVFTAETIYLAPGESREYFNGERHYHRWSVGETLCRDRISPLLPANVRGFDPVGDRIQLTSDQRDNILNLRQNTFVEFVLTDGERLRRRFRFGVALEEDDQFDIYLDAILPDPVDAEARLARIEFPLISSVRIGEQTIFPEDFTETVEDDNSITIEFSENALTNPNNEFTLRWQLSRASDRILETNNEDNDLTRFLNVGAVLATDGELFRVVTVEGNQVTVNRSIPNSIQSARSYTYRAAVEQLNETTSVQANYQDHCTPVEAVRNFVQQVFEDVAPMAELNLYASQSQFGIISSRTPSSSYTFRNVCNEICDSFLGSFTVNDAGQIDFKVYSGSYGQEDLKQFTENDCLKWDFTSDSFFNIGELTVNYGNEQQYQFDSLNNRIFLQNDYARQVNYLSYSREDAEAFAQSYKFLKENETFKAKIDFLGEIPFEIGELVRLNFVRNPVNEDGSRTFLGLVTSIRVQSGKTTIEVSDPGGVYRRSIRVAPDDYQFTDGQLTEDYDYGYVKDDDLQIFDKIIT